VEYFINYIYIFELRNYILLLNFIVYFAIFFGLAKLLIVIKFRYTRKLGNKKDVKRA